MNKNTIEVRDRLVLGHLHVVKAIARQVRETLPVHVDPDDLIHAGILGLFDAAAKFDPAKGILFATYAKHRIRGAMFDSLRQLDWASRDMRRKFKRWQAAEQELEFDLNRIPSEDEIIQKLGEDCDWREVVALMARGGDVSLTRSTEDDRPIPEARATPAWRPDNLCLEGELSERLLTALDVLKPRYRTVMELYYREDLTMKEIGRRMGIHESRVCQMHAASLRKLREALEEAGVRSSQAFTAAA